MCTRNSLFKENELLELTDVELETVSGGFTIGGNFAGPFGGFTTSSANQFSYANSSFGNVYFGSLTSTQGNFQIGGLAQSSNFYNNGFNNSPF